MSTQPAGWYDDGHGATRFWDGAAWTSHVAPAALPAPDALVVHETPPTPPAPTAPQSSAGAVAPYAPPPQPYAPAAQPYAAQPQFVQSAPYGPVAPYVVAPVELAPNGVGVAGFVVGLVSLFLPLFFGVIGGLVGLGLSIAGVAKTGARKGLAIAGLVISILAIVFIL